MDSKGKKAKRDSDSDEEVGEFPRAEHLASPPKKKIKQSKSSKSELIVIDDDSKVAPDLTSMLPPPPPPGNKVELSQVQRDALTRRLPAP